MTTSVTKESLIARIVDLECGARSLKEDYTLAAYKMLLATMEAEPVAYINEDALADVYCGLTSMMGPTDTIGDIALYTRSQPAQTGVDDDVRNVIGLLENIEWAEHCTSTVLGSRLEAEITRIIDRAQPAPETEREPIAWLNDAYLARGVVDGEAGSEDAGPGYIPVYREQATQPAPAHKLIEELLSLREAYAELQERYDLNVNPEGK